MQFLHYAWVIHHWMVYQQSFWIVSFLPHRRIVDRAPFNVHKALVASCDTWSRLASHSSHSPVQLFIPDFIFTVMLSYDLHASWRKNQNVSPPPPQKEKRKTLITTGTIILYSTKNHYFKRPDSKNKLARFVSHSLHHLRPVLGWVCRTRLHRHHLHSWLLSRSQHPWLPPIL